MKAEDLRPGNLVLLGGEITTVTVNNIQYHERFEPIVITADLLLGMGFNRGNGIVINENFYEMEFEKISIVINPDNHVTYIDQGEEMSIRIINKAVYLHDLQNLCYALNGEELPQLTIANTTET